MKTLIAIPCHDKVDAAFVRCLLALERSGEMAVQLLANSLVYVSREQLCRQALENDCDAVLFLDSDMTFAPDLFQKLKAAGEEENAEVVTALAFRRRPPYTPCIWERIRIGEGDPIVEEFDDIPEGRVDIDACGMAGCLISTKIIRKVFERYGTCFSPLPKFGEDISFCIRAKQCGANIICETDAEMGHLSQLVVDRSAFNSYRQKGEK